MKKLIVTTLSLVMLCGCATVPHGADYVPLVDSKDKDPTKLSTDTQECQAYARQRMSAKEAAMNGAIAGALAGAVLGALIAPGDYRNEGARQGAGIGALGGAAKAGVDANDTQESIIKKCLAGRGYVVLN